MFGLNYEYKLISAVVHMWWNKREYREFINH